MSAACYDEAISRVLKSEGGYVNHPSDPGGPTNFGITIADYRRYVKADATATDVRLMKVESAKAIYRTKYWNAMACDALPAGLDYAVFDYGVNSGTGRAPKVLRRVIGLPDVAPFADVLSALNKRDVKAVIQAYDDERLRFLKSLKIWGVFGVGWNIRVASVNAAALHMAEHGSNVAAVPSPRPPVAVPASDVAPQGKGEVPAPTAVKKIIVGAPTAAGGAGGAHWWDWIAAHPVETGIIGLTGVAVVGGAVYALNRWHATRQDASTPGIIPVPALKAA